MLLTKASEYALLSLVLLEGKKEPVDVESISKELNISKSFLAKILQSLARDEILSSFKGINGGFLLSKSSEDINLKEIIKSVERKDSFVFECNEHKSENRCKLCKIDNTFKRLQDKIDEMLEKISLKDIVEERVVI